MLARVEADAVLCQLGVAKGLASRLFLELGRVGQLAVGAQGVFPRLFDVVQKQRQQGFTQSEVERSGIVEWVVQQHRQIHNLDYVVPVATDPGLVIVARPRRLAK